MKKLTLIVNNQNNELKYENNFFIKKELKIILDLYAKKVSEGIWKDYVLNISKKNVSFSVFKRSSENPAFNICKNFEPGNSNFRYYISDSKGNILKMSKNLMLLINSFNWNKYKIVN